MKLATMKILRWAYLIVPSAALLAGTAIAQTASLANVQQPGPLQQVASQPDDGFALAAGATAAPASPSNQTPAPPVSAGAPAVQGPLAPGEQPVPLAGGEAAPLAGTATAAQPFCLPGPWLAPPSKDETPLHSRLDPCDCLGMRFLEANWDVFYGVPPPDEPPPDRRALPQPWSSPPFPGHEWQGYPLVGVPADSADGLLNTALYAGDNNSWLKQQRISFDGWATASGNWSNATQTNLPETYWIVPNSFQARPGSCCASVGLPIPSRPTTSTGASAR